jgi:predicted PurR-regulated permease PerM
MLVIGGGVIALVENLISPWFARLARFRLPTPVMIISMFGGVLGIGPSGIVVGPLALRLAQEALAIAREERATGA